MFHDVIHWLLVVYNDSDESTCQIWDTIQPQQTVMQNVVTIDCINCHQLIAIRIPPQLMLEAYIRFSGVELFCHNDWNVMTATLVNSITHYYQNWTGVYLPLLNEHPEHRSLVPTVKGSYSFRQVLRCPFRLDFPRFGAFDSLLWTPVSPDYRWWL